MNIDTLYKYLKLVVPNDYKVDMGKDFITVVRSFGGMYVVDLYYLSKKGEYVILSAMNYDLNKYARKIFGKPLSKEAFSTYNEYYFNIPKELREE